MRPTNLAKTLSLGLLVLAIGLSPALVRGAGTDEDDDKDEDKQEQQARRAAAPKVAAQGDCNPGTASADLDVNNVSARVFNTGSLFFSKDDQARYEVPKGSGLHSVFASGIWIGGYANDELRMAAATYAQFGQDFEFFPGPLDDSGNPPANCQQYDRIYKVSQEDIARYDRGESATADMLDWPADLGAPVVDGDGNPNNYNLEGGDRPEVIGDQTTWWVMNDMGGEHLTTLTPPIGLEVQVTAFSFRTADALNNTTFYKYKLLYKGSETLRDVYLGLWSDPDLGNANDDFVGSDTTLGLGFVYNGDNLDETASGYGDRPPALGYDFFQGPLVNNDGEDNDGDGQVDEAEERLKMTKFVYYNNDDTDQGNPDNAGDFYDYLRGRWKDGSRITFGADGAQGGDPANFMFPGDPPEYWSEDNTDGRGTRNTPADRRFLMSTGPFTMEPGATQEIVFGIVWSQTRDRIGSVKALKRDDILAQGAFDFDFDLPEAPDPPRVETAELDNSIVLSWDYRPTDNNYLNRYDNPSPFLVESDVADTTYTFEGYKIYQYESPDVPPEQGEVVMTLDVENNVTTVVDNAIDPSTGAPIQVVSAAGTNSGVRNFVVIENDLLSNTPLTNNKEYYYGVQAYAYNQFSDPKIYQSPIERVTVVPSNVSSRDGGTVQNADPLDQLEGEIDKISDARINAQVVDPLSLTGDEYSVSFYEYTPESSGEGSKVNNGEPFLTYNIARSGEVIFSGEEYYEENGREAPFGDDVYMVDGLSFTIKDAPANWAADGGGIVEVQYAGDSVEPDESGALYNGNTVWHGLNSSGTYYLSAGSEGGALSALKRYISYASPRDFELRFTEEGGYAVHGFSDQTVAEVPFEIWDVGVGTPDDESDDRQMIPFLLSPADSSTASWQYGLSDAWLDPWAGYPGSDLIYWMDPQDADSYSEFASGAESVGAGNSWDVNGDGAANPTDATGYSMIDYHGGFVYPIGRLIFGDIAGTGTPPPAGTTIRFVTTKPITPGDAFTIDTGEYAPERDQGEVAQNSLEDIGIVPNPYRGASEYDVSATQDQVRFINLPERATIRVFTLSGTLVRTLEKSSPETQLRWDLRTREGLPIASGMYLVHIEVPEVGERVLKFGVVKKRIQLDTF